MELDTDTRDLNIELYNNDSEERLYIYDDKVYDTNSTFKNLKIELDSSTNTINMATITITKECAKIISISLFKKMFDDYSGKKVGEDFTLDELVEKFEFPNSSPPQNMTLTENKEKKEKKKSPKMTGYKIFTQKEKTIITAECKKLKETGQSPKFMAVASTLWKAKTDEEKKVFNDMVNNQ